MQLVRARKARQGDLMLRLPVTRPPVPALPIEGGCHCGGVRYAVTARPLAVNACHCSDCKRLTGGPAGVYLHVAKAALDIRSGQFDLFRRTGGSGNQISILRCRHCGARMWHLPDAAPDLVILCSGTLDQTGWVIPTSHIYIEEAAPDAVAADDTLAVEAFQTTRQALWDRFSEIYP